MKQKIKYNSITFQTTQLLHDIIIDILMNKLNKVKKLFKYKK